MLSYLIERVKTYQNVDETKIRLFGVSNGGALALSAAVEITDPAVDVVVCCISQTNTNQYKDNNFYYPSNHENTGNNYPNDGYDTIQNNMPQRKIIQLNGELDRVVPYDGGDFVGLNFLSADESAFAFAKSQGFNGNLLSPTQYGPYSEIANYGNVIFMKDKVGHQVSPDMKHLIKSFLENDYSVEYPSAPTVTTPKKILALHGGGGNGIAFRNQPGMQSLMSNLDQYNIVFANAPTGLWIQDPPGGKDTPTDDPNWAQNSIDYLDNFIATHGPFDGVIGYSQGAAFIPVYLANSSNSFDFAVMYNGYLPYTHTALMNTINSNAPFNIPSVVFSGEYDFGFKDMASDLASKFENSLNYRSNIAGHHLPVSSDPMFRKILDFIRLQN